MDVKEFLKKKFEMLAIISIVILGDVIPIICVMVGLWIVKSIARFYGFEELVAIKILSTFSEIFMVILYLITAVLSIKAVYKLFKDGE